MTLLELLQKLLFSAELYDAHIIFSWNIRTPEVLSSWTDCVMSFLHIYNKLIILFAVLKPAVLSL